MVGSHAKTSSPSARRVGPKCFSNVSGPQPRNAILCVLPRLMDLILGRAEIHVGKELGWSPAVFLKRIFPQSSDFS